MTLHAKYFRFDWVSYLKEVRVEGEIWKDVPEVDGFKASSLGRTWAPSTTAEMPNGGFRSYVTKPTFGTKGKSFKNARHIYFMTSYRGKNFKVHRLVCSAFHGPAPFPRAVVIHIDEDATNNRPENLRWGTQKENLNSPGFIAYCKARTGENSPGAKGRAKKS